MSALTPEKFFLLVGWSTYAFPDVDSLHQDIFLRGTRECSDNGCVSPQNLVNDSGQIRQHGFTIDVVSQVEIIYLRLVHPTIIRYNRWIRECLNKLLPKFELGTSILRNGPYQEEKSVAVIPLPPNMPSTHSSPSLASVSGRSSNGLTSFKEPLERLSWRP